MPSPLPTSPGRIAAISLLALATVCTSYVSWKLCEEFSVGPFRTDSFNQVKWQSLAKGTTSSGCYRGGIAHDIRENALRIGMSKAEVLLLLGPPDFERSNGPLEYLLGMCSGLQIDFDTLDIHLDGDGKLTKVQIVQH